ncbi:MAG: recombination protein RecR [bacterium]|nr:recombination protein RecR [bacterium]
MAFEKLIEHFLKFPGIGPRQAKRFGYFLADADGDFAEELARLILEVKKNVVQCPSCFCFHNARPGAPATASACGICANLNRDNSLLMVVEKDVDLENIEKSGVYDGRYFVLGGVLSLVNGLKKQNSLRFKELFSKVQENSPEEVILATSATVEGENTARYAEKILEPLLGTGNGLKKISRLGRGLSTGTELEYIDGETMSDALESRK